MSLLYVKTSKEANAVGTLWDRGRGILLSEKGCQGRVLRSTVMPWPVCVWLSWLDVPFHKLKRHRFGSG